MVETSSAPVEQIKTFYICQKNTHLFRDLYVHTSMFVLLIAGSKKIVHKSDDSDIAQAGELLIFPSGSYITIENRIFSGRDYRAFCVSYPDSVLEQVFAKDQRSSDKAILVKQLPSNLAESLLALPKVLDNEDLPLAIQSHKALEPLVWLKSMGISLNLGQTKPLDCQLRDLIRAEPDKKWRVGDAAAQFAISEASLRRKLALNNTSFSDIVTNTRLEHGLTLLQTTDLAISTIALDCGFSSPSHFSDVFRQRFKLQPKHIRQTLD